MTSLLPHTTRWTLHLFHLSLFHTLRGWKGYPVFSTVRALSMTAPNSQIPNETDKNQTLSETFAYRTCPPRWVRTESPNAWVLEK